METVGLLEYLWKLLVGAFHFPLWIFEIVPFVLFIFHVLAPKYQLRLGNDMVNKSIQLIKRHSLVILMLVFFIGMVNASYDMYGNKQDIVNSLQQQNTELKALNKPELMLDLYNPFGFTDNLTKIGINCSFRISNNGEKTAYQTRVKLVVADINTLADTFIPKELYEPNPIFKNERKISDGNINWLRTYKGEQSIMILVYANLIYSDAPIAGNLYEQPFWFAIRYDTKSNITAYKGADQEWIELFKPYIK